MPLRHELSSETSRNWRCMGMKEKACADALSGTGRPGYRATGDRGRRESGMIKRNSASSFSRGSGRKNVEPPAHQ